MSDISSSYLRLSAQGVAVEIDVAHGGRLSSLRVADIELLGAGERVTGQPPDIFWGCFVMAPFVGRLPGGRFTFGGRDWTLPCNTPAHAIHGLVFDRPWHVDAATQISCEFDERWPFGGAVTQYFLLDSSALTIRARVTNETRPHVQSLFSSLVTVRGTFFRAI